MKSRTIEDKLGICASLVCMVHCIAIPILLILGFDSIRQIIDQEWIEMGFIGASLAIGAFSFLRGYLQHRQHFIPVLFLAGFLLLVNGEAVSHFVLAAGLSITGALIIAYAHLQNLKWKRMQMFTGQL